MPTSYMYSDYSVLLPNSCIRISAIIDYIINSIRISISIIDSSRSRPIT